MSSRSGNLKLTGSRGTRSRRIPFYIYNLFFIHKYNASPIAAEIYKALELLRQQAPKIYPKFQPVIDGYEKFLATFDEKFPTYTSGYKLQQISPLARTLKALLAFIGATLSIALFAVAVISTTSATYSPLAIGFFISAYAAVILSIVHGSLSRKANYRLVRTDGSGITISCPSSQSPVIMLPRWMRSAFLGTFLFFASPGSTNAQTISGKIINGVDSTGVPGITVKVQTTIPYTHYTGTTGPNGEFSVVTNIEDENYASGSVEVTVTSISSKPYITIQNIDKQEAEITIYDITGREIKKINAPLTNGINNIQWNARNEYNEPVSNGVYLTKISVGGKILNKIFMIMKNDIEGTPISHIKKNTVNKTSGIEDINVNGTVTTTDSQNRFENTTTSITYNSNTNLTICVIPKDTLENKFIENGKEINSLSNQVNYFDITNTKKPLYPIKINITGQPLNIQTAITNAANSIDSITQKNFTEIGTGNITVNTVNNDTTTDILTKNAHGKWKTFNGAGNPLTGTLYINNSHNLTTEEITAYAKKELIKLILNTQKNIYNNNSILFPKGTQEIDNDTKKLLQTFYNNILKTTHTQTTTNSNNINILGKVAIPDTTTWTVRAVKNAIVRLRDGLNEQIDTTDAAGMYMFENVNKGIKKIIIDSIKADGTKTFCQYVTKEKSMTQDSTRTDIMFPNTGMDFRPSIYGIYITLDQFKYQTIEGPPYDNDPTYHKPLYPMQVYIETNCPVNWKPYMINALNDWNTLTHTKLFEIVNTPYTATDKTAVNVTFLNEGTGGNDGSTILMEEINEIPTKYKIILNTGSTMNGTTDIYRAMAHELLRTILFVGPNELSFRREHVAYIARGPPYNITNDEKVQVFIIANLDPLIDVNTYIGWRTW